MSTETAEVKLHFLDYWRVIRVRFGIIVLAFLLVVITTGVTTYFTPKQYESFVKMEVQPEAANVKLFDPTRSEFGGDSRFAPTQFQVLQTTEVLYPVIEDLKLQEKWAEGSQPLDRQQCYFMLRDLMSVREVRNTNLMDVAILSREPAEAAEIANKIAEVYIRIRIEEQETLYSRALSKIQEEVSKQQAKVSAAFTTLRRIEVESGITDLSTDSTEGVMSPLESVLMTQEQTVDQTRNTVGGLEEKIKQIEKLKGEELMRALTTLEIQDPIVLNVLPQFQMLEAEEANLLNSGLARNHPKITAVRAQKAVQIRQLEDSIESIRASLAINLKIAQNTLQGLEDKLQGKRGEFATSRSSRGDYLAAKATYAQAKMVLEAAEMRYQTQIMEFGMPRTPAKIWQKAEVPSFHSKPRVAVNMVGGVLVGLVVGLGLAFFIEYLDTSVKTLEDVENFLDVPVLAVIPKGINLLHREPSDTPDAEAYRILRTNIEFNRKSADANAITIVSGGPSEGKSTTLCNLAFTCAQGGYKVLVVDADLRRPVQHELWDLDNAVGLTNYLTTDMSLEEVIVTTPIDNLYVMPSGILPSDAVGILNSQRMSDMIVDLKSRFDIVFFDAPPILGVSDASVLASEVDLTILVVQHRRFPRSMLLRVKQAVVNVGGTVLGVVLNNVDTKHDQGYEYYTSYYKYYYSGPRNKTTRASKPAEKTDSLASTQAGDDEY